jgi:hypothetical protein
MPPPGLFNGFLYAAIPCSAGFARRPFESGTNLVHHGERKHWLELLLVLSVPPLWIGEIFVEIAGNMALFSPSL